MRRPGYNWFAEGHSPYQSNKRLGELLVSSHSSTTYFKTYYFLKFSDPLMNVLVCRYNHLLFEKATVQDNRAMPALDVSLGSVHCSVSENIDLRTYCPSMIRQASSSHNQSSFVLVSDCVTICQIRS